MRFLLAPILGAALLCTQTKAQSPPADSRALQSILEEVQKLRQDLRMTAATIQRAQLLLYRMRLQMDSVSRATERFEQARGELAQIQSQRNRANEQMRNLQDQLDRTQDSATRKQIQQAMEYTKNWTEQFTTGEPEAQAREAECASELRLEQEKLDELQRQFDALDHKLEVAAQSGLTR
jgi:DNA repair exonuclease SbcCD ATPase subunit